MATTVTIQAGDDDAVTLPFPEAAPGMTAYARVREYPTGPVLHEWTSTNNTLTVGSGQVTLAVSDSTSWMWRSGEFDIRLNTGQQVEVAGPYRVRVRSLLSGDGVAPAPGGGGTSTGPFLTVAHNTDTSAHPDIRALIATGGSGGGTTTPDATTTTKGQAVILGGTASAPTVPYNKVTGAPTVLPPTGGAGGVLSGTFPNPGFAFDMATQGELDSLAATIPETVRDVIGAALVAGSNVSIVPNDNADTITISATLSGSSYTDEQVQDAVAALVAAGSHSGITFSYNDASNALSATVTAPSWAAITGKPTFASVATSGSYVDLADTPIIPPAYTDEQAQDALAALFVAGSHTGVTFSYDDDTGRINATVTGGGGGAYSDEQSQDAAAALIAAGSHYGITFFYDDTSNALSASVGGLSKADVGLSNVDDTADVDKPVSAAAQAALNAKQPLDSDLTTIAGLDAAQAGVLASDGAGWVRKTYAQTKSALGLTKADVGLGQVDNTSDLNKPVSTAQQSALSALTDAVPEIARDSIGAALVAGSNVTITPNDVADTITIGVTIPQQYSDEQAQDAFASLFAAGTHSGITFTYNDAGNAMSAVVAAQSWTQITGKPTFATVAATGAYADLTGRPTIPSSYSQLTGTVPQSALPAVALTDYLGVVGTQAAMLALTGQRGDWTTRSDRGTDWQLIADDATQLASWREMSYPASPVSSVNGRTGSVTGLAEATDVAASLGTKQAADSDLTTIAALDSTTAGALATDGGGWVRKTYAQLKTALGLVKADVGLGSADNTPDALKPVSAAQQAALDGKVGTADTRLTDTRTPTDGTVTDAKVAAGASIAESKLNLATDAAAGTASRRTLGTGSQQAAAGNDSRIIGAAPQTALTAHTADTTNPHATTKAQVGLGNVDNTSDSAKPLSSAATTALAGKANTSHAHGVTDLTATGTKNSNTYLRGDNTWAAVTSAVSSVNAETGVVVLDAADVGASRLLVGGAYSTELDIDPTPITPAAIGAQPADADLTTIAALDATQTGVLGSEGSGWVRRTYTQVKAALALATIATSGRLLDTTDLEPFGGTIPDGHVPVWWGGTFGGLGGFQLRSVVNQYQRAVIGGVANAGSITATPWTPNALTANDHEASIEVAGLTVAAPSNGTDSQRITLVMTATGAERTITLDAAIEREAGVPATVVVPAGQCATAAMRRFGTRGTWVCSRFVGLAA